MADGSGLVTGVLTSCGRLDLLRRTLVSFFATNTGPFDRLIVVEDGGEIPVGFQSEFREHPIEWISSGEWVGQIAAIDYAYSRVLTPYIFHMEDDWEFHREGYMERSLVVLEANPKCVQVWIRHFTEDQPHPVDEHTFEDDGVVWHRMARNFRALCGRDMVLWHGFAFNPGLRRLQDYIAIDGYGINARYEPGNPGRAEWLIGEVYHHRGYFAAILADHDGAGYVRHIGWDRHVQTPRSPVDGGER